MHAVVVQSQQELKECLGIRREVFTIEQQVPAELEVDLSDCLGSNVTHVLLYDEEHHPVGTARMKPVPQDNVKVQRVAVRRLARGRGYGEALMRMLESLAMERNYRKITLDAQYHVKGFYEKLGYQAIGEKFLEAGIEHVRMEKVLLSSM